MYIRLFIYTNVKMHTYIYIYTVCIHIDTYVYIYICICVYVCACEFIFTYIYISIYICICVSICVDSFSACLDKSRGPFRSSCVLRDFLPSLAKARLTRTESTSPLVAITLLCALTPRVLLLLRNLHRQLSLHWLEVYLIVVNTFWAP